jgi:hypothetical protein
VERIDACNREAVDGKYRRPTNWKEDPKENIF